MQRQEQTVPILRFPEFKNNWALTTLGKQTICLDNKRIPLKEEDRKAVSGEFPYYGASGIIDYINDYIFDEPLVLLAEDGANIMMRNSLVAFVAQGKYWVNNHAHVYRAKGSTEFLALYLENLRYDKYNTGTAQPKLNGDTCKKIPLNFPNKREQKKIAAFLGAVDEKITQLQKKKELLDTYKKGCMQKLFSQELRFKDDNDNDYPEWEEKKLQSLAQIKTGSRDTQNKEDNGSYPFFVRSNNVERINSYVIEGEAVLTSGDGVGVGKNFHYINGKFDYHQRVYAIFNFSEELNGLFFFHYFKRTFLKRVIRLSAKNSVDSVRMSMIAEMGIPQPIRKEQDKIADFLSAIDRKIDLVSKELNQAKTFKKGLLQQMFV
jgi:type I restriction enzyme S subunit